LKKCDESDWLPHRLLFLERHISYPDCRPTNIKAEFVVLHICFCSRNKCVRQNQSERM